MSLIYNGFWIMLVNRTQIDFRSRQLPTLQRLCKYQHLSVCQQPKLNKTVIAWDAFIKIDLTVYRFVSLNWSADNKNDTYNKYGEICCKTLLKFEGGDNSHRREKQIGHFSWTFVILLIVKRKANALFIRVQSPFLAHVLRNCRILLLV